MSRWCPSLAGTSLSSGTEISEAKPLSSKIFATFLGFSLHAFNISPKATHFPKHSYMLSIWVAASTLTTSEKTLLPARLAAGSTAFNRHWNKPAKTQTATSDTYVNVVPGAGGGPGGGDTGAGIPCGTSARALGRLEPGGPHATAQLFTAKINSARRFGLNKCRSKDSHRTAEVRALRSNSLKDSNKRTKLSGDSAAGDRSRRKKTFETSASTCKAPKMGPTISSARPGKRVGDCAKHP
mmetsp:Transcript_83385/g.223071  ORF Transcript_83385/g.223071 Transcript_83385/m.223071 type:complete len:239 (-) Transcript_83385:963-1679(-)